MKKRDETKMTPQEMQRIRIGLGLSRVQFGTLIGFEGNSIAQSVQRLETGAREITRAQALLTWAYAGGWRPSIWPVELRSETTEGRIAMGQKRIADTL